MNHETSGQRQDHTDGPASGRQTERLHTPQPQPIEDARRLASVLPAAAAASNRRNEPWPLTLITRFCSPAPVEFSNAGRYHNFNLQLAGTLDLELHRQGRWEQRSIVPGHASLNVAHEAFRCIVRPSPGTLALHVCYSPRWLDQVSETEIGCEPSRGTRLQPWLGIWPQQIRDSAWALVRTLQQPEAPGRLCLEEQQLALAVALLQSQSTRRERDLGRGQLASGKLQRAVEYLLAHMDTDVRLTTLAAEVGLSPFHFARAFKASVGLAPHQYVSEMRLETARTLLTATTRSLTDIALSLGYDSSSHFSNAFRRRFAVSPSRFRAATR